MPKRKRIEENFISRYDLLPPCAETLHLYTETLHPLAKFYGFEQVVVPIVEDGRIFAPLAKAGFLDERTPIQCKIARGDMLAIRPSGLLGIIRAYASHRMYELPHPLKFFFEGGCAFLELGARGSVVAREEMGLVMIDEYTPIAEAEIVQMIWKALEEMKIRGASSLLKINATGCSKCRVQFRSSFMSYFRSRSARLCKECKRYFKRMPTRVLRCGEEKCRLITVHAPQILDFLCEGCKKHLRGFLEFLDEARIPYFLDPSLFKEGTWFSTFVFEFVHGNLDGEQNPAAPQSVKEETPPSGAPSDIPQVVIAEGGRISRAAELIASRRIEAVGGSIFLDALALLSFEKKRQSSVRDAAPPKIFLAQLGELAKRKSLILMETLRGTGIEVRESLGRDSIKAQLKAAERIGAAVALILGHKEALDGTIIVREVESGIQETIPQERLVEFLKQKLKK